MGAGAKALLIVAMVAGTGMIVHRTMRNAQLRNCASLTAFVPHEASESVQVAFLSDGLKIGALLTKPKGSGPFPAYIHNHGAMTRTHASDPLWKTPDEVDAQLTAAGYVVLRPARRGYFGSEGSTTTYWVQGSSLTAAEVIEGAYAEAHDVHAAIDYLRGCPFISERRIAIGGHSVGGLVTVIAATTRADVAGAVSINGGITWTQNGVEQGYPAVSAVWRAEAGKLRVPVLLLYGKSDNVVIPEVGRELESLLRRRSAPVTFTLYDGGHFPFPVEEIVLFLDTLRR